MNDNDVGNRNVNQGRNYFYPNTLRPEKTWPTKFRRYCIFINRKYRTKRILQYIFTDRQWINTGLGVAWCLTGHTLLPETMVTQFIDAYMQHTHPWWMWYLIMKHKWWKIIIAIELLWHLKRYAVSVYYEDVYMYIFGPSVANSISGQSIPSRCCGRDAHHRHNGVPATADE